MAILAPVLLLTLGLGAAGLLAPSRPRQPPSANSPDDSPSAQLPHEYEPEQFRRRQRAQKLALGLTLLALLLDALFRLGVHLVQADELVTSDLLICAFWVIPLGLIAKSYPLTGSLPDRDRHWEYTVALAVLTFAALSLALLQIALVSGSTSSGTVVSGVLGTVLTTGLTFVAFLLAGTTDRSAQLVHYVDASSPHAPAPGAASPSERSRLLEQAERPRVFISRVASCSPISYLTFSWITPVLREASRTKSLVPESLPFLHKPDRPPQLWSQIRQKVGLRPGRWMNPLLWRILSVNRRMFYWQSALALLNAFLYYLPAYYLREVILFLEKRTPDTPLRDGFIASLGLLVSLAVGAIVDGQLWWVSNSILATRVRVQLNSLVFDKTLRRKDVTGVSSDGPRTDVPEEAKEKKGIFEVDDGAATFSTKSQVLNIFTIDVDRCSDFSVWAFSLIDAPAEIMIGTAFLYQLLGWSSFAGLSIAVMLLPINHWAASQFADVQDKLMAARDRRTSLMNEVIGAMRMLKFFALETQFEGRVIKARAEELGHLRRNLFLEVAFQFLWGGAPILCILVSFISYTVFMGLPLTPSTAFASLAVFNELRFALNVVPDLVVNAIQCLVSLRRIENYLRLPEVGSESELLDTTEVDTADPTVAFRSATVTWPSLVPKLEDQDAAPLGSATPSRRIFELQDVSIDFPCFQLSLVSGPIGSGKTLLLLALLGEAELRAGQIVAPPSSLGAEELPTMDWERMLNETNWVEPGRRTAYVPQSAWLQSSSIKENILFGLPYRAVRYTAVLAACSLVADLSIFEDGDDTEIGEKGVALSGGMRARVSLARAVYSRASLILLDDVLSAVDAHTAFHLYTHCLKGPLLAGRTVVIVSHHAQLLAPGAAFVVSLDGGRVKYQGDTETFLLQFKVEEDEEPIEAVKPKAVPKNKALNLVVNQSAVTSEASSASEAESESESDDEREIEVKAPKKMIEDEQRAEGRVSWAVWKLYLSLAGSLMFWGTFASIFLGTKLLEVGETLWLAYWTRSYETTEAGDDEPHHSLLYYLGGYAALSLAGIVISTGQWIVLYLGTLSASEKLHRNLLHNILRAPLRFFETNAAGRILNRFGKDLESIDAVLPDNVGRTLMLGLSVFTTLIVISSVSPLFLLAFAFLLIFYLRFAANFSSTSRELRRMESVSKSPLYSIYEEAISGIAVIRAFGSSQLFQAVFLERVETQSKFYWYLWAVNRWLSIRFSLLSAVVVGATGAVLVGSTSVDAALAGFALTFSLNISNDMLFLVRRYTALELTMVAVERCKEYSETPQEAPEIIEPRPPPSWPHAGQISVTGLSVAYAPSLPDVLHDLTFSVAGGQKIGIVGSTGSGKSTIALSLFRFIEARQGKILIDGLNIADIGLLDLRRSLTIIPQDPTILSGTLRESLDLFHDYSDAAIFDALRRVHLIEAVQPTEEMIEAGEANMSPFYDLHSAVSEGGTNFSQGQRQLLCMARSLLAKNKIIIMDEATASVDSATDEAISATIRSELAGSTLLVIAHRLRTIIDFDKVMLLEAGRLVEFDTPVALLSRIDSRFYALCRASGKNEFKTLLKMAKGQKAVVPKRKLVRGMSSKVVATAGAGAGGK